ncbi:hypothetical protein DFQ26_001823, partial [Actinomortierella ambigua]
NTTSNAASTFPTTYTTFTSTTSSAAVTHDTPAADTSNTVPENLIVVTPDNLSLLDFTTSPNPEPAPRTMTSLPDNFLRTVRPDRYDGKSTGAKAEDWLLSMENHFAAYGIANEVLKLNGAILYLSGDAARWYELVKASITTDANPFTKFVESFKLRFTRVHDSDSAFQALCQLQQTGNISLYITKFQSLALRVSSQNQEVK